MNMQVTGDTFYRFSLDNLGTLNFGPENAAQDITLSWIGNSNLGLSASGDAGLTITSNTTSLVIAGKTNPNNQLLIGLNSRLSSIQGVNQGVEYFPLLLNPSGSYVSINTSSIPYYPLDVNGIIHSSLGYYMPTSGGTQVLLNYNDENTIFTSMVTWST